MEMGTISNQSSPNETGGMLLGYTASSGDVVVTAIIGPGDNAKHARYFFMPDSEYQQSKLNDHYHSTQGKESYLGDWHTHPYGSGMLSWIDKRTLANIALTESSGIKHPVMAIFSGKPGSWEVHAVRFLNTKKILFWDNYEIEELVQIIF